ncbi:SDR family NAD(P)-dependent oxidoreductase [Arthrobacter sp. zg-Y820]|uniref:SDR family NAD(P)-dependent oxidoreductase n=1 Tax=unclassified Arthrobacter TaxID=235627 RepID=UPI001E4CEA7F|nr:MULTISPECIES: SDR family NAD(P)-dependent oxidoreductase [unclassified Arthrobacter]MCC9196556.1 SDR family NAD(P)-dependent oxidoreductase [Arthrobacter sp. zg-Y820]MDK1279418.1 SDR family NAD(P)-dependent oxidoreductase [Arthrobacter sp. zg.Y820]WIB08201.1 SDR family NAD(P)-dependent oxidoreductase [Arthrobacter sp. zg-Y820]
MPNPRHLGTESLIGEWLDDPAGRTVLIDLLARRSPDARALYAIRKLPLSSLMSLSHGAVTPEYLDLMVHAANRLRDEPTVPPATSHLFPSAAPQAPNDWEEPIIEGRFDGKTVVVTGASSGIGRATALRVAREGGQVLAIDLSTLRMEALLEENPELGITGIVADISSQSDVNKIAVQARGRVDCLAVVAGIADNMVALHEVEDELWESVFRINVDGPFRVSRAIIPLMLSRGAGSIVNVSSQAGLRGSIAGAAYTASKHAVIGMTRSAAFIYSPRGIRVNAVIPRPTKTALESNYGSLGGAGPLPTASLTSPEVEAAQIASPMTYLLSDDAANVTGAILPADEGWGVA